MTETSSKDTAIFNKIKKECRHAGTSVRKACLRAGVNYKTVSHWKTKTPTSIEIYQKLKAALEEIKKENE